MKFAYNGNLLEDERIQFVANEIVRTYPFVSLVDAKEVAMLEEPISKDKDFEMEFKRLYHIILVVQDKKQAHIIYKDLLKLLGSNEGSMDLNKYYRIVEEIYGFLLDERDFPYLDEFEEN